VRPLQVGRRDEALDNRLADFAFDAEKPRCLRHRERHSGHFVEFCLNALRDQFNVHIISPGTDRNGPGLSKMNAKAGAIRISREIREFSSVLAD
jgi:hypothetical protein